jgi:trigger factor
MNFIKCEKLEKSMAELQFSIDAEAFKGAVADVFKKEGKKYSVPGFRKGKAPRSLIEKMYGADVFTYDAINELFPAAYEEAVKAAEDKKYVLMNVPTDRLKEITEVLPGIKSPTIMPLATEGWSSVHTVLDQKCFWEIIGKLKALGAQGILVLPIEKMIL